MDIVEQLRALSCDHAEHGPYDHSADPDLLAEAAATIEALRKEVEALRAFVASIATMPDAACARDEAAWSLRDQGRALSERQP